jgi:predicted regulator of Ras-like GTPase activity (Roadblock/LC7/MglB family)
MSEGRDGSVSARPWCGGEELTIVAMAAPALALIDELKTSVEAVAVAIVSDDGRMVQGALPSGVSDESFAVMSATIVGAAATVSSDLKRTPPDHIIIRGHNFTMIVARFDSGSLLVTVVGAAADPEQLTQRIDEFVLSQRSAPPGA